MAELRLLNGQVVDVAVALLDDITQVRKQAAVACGVPMPFVQLLDGERVLDDSLKVAELQCQTLHVQIIQCLPFEISKVAPGHPQNASGWWDDVSSHGDFKFDVGTAVVMSETSYSYSDDEDEEDEEDEEEKVKFEAAAVFSITGPDDCCPGSWAFQLDVGHPVYDQLWMSDNAHNPKPGIVQCASGCDAWKVDWYPSLEAARAAVVAKPQQQQPRQQQPVPVAAGAETGAECGSRSCRLRCLRLRF